MEITKHFAPSIATHGVEEAALVNGDDFDGDALFPFAPVDREGGRESLVNLAYTHRFLYSDVMPVLYRNIIVRGNQKFNSLLRTLCATPRLRNRVRGLAALHINRCDVFGDDIEKYLAKENLVFPNLHTLEFSHLPASKDPIAFFADIFRLASRSPKLHTFSTCLLCPEVDPTTPDRRWITWPKLTGVKVLHLHGRGTPPHQFPILDFFPDLTTLVVETYMVQPIGTGGPRNLKTLVIRGAAGHLYETVCKDRLKHLKCGISNGPQRRPCRGLGRDYSDPENPPASPIQSIQILDGHPARSNVHKSACPVLKMDSMFSVICHARVLLGLFNNLEVLHMPPMCEYALFCGRKTGAECLAQAVGGLRQYLKNEKPSVQLKWRHVKENMTEQPALACKCNPGCEEAVARTLGYLTDINDVMRLFYKGHVELDDHDE